MMKNLLLIFAVLICSFTLAQYNINFKEAPLNKIPLQYKLEHFNLKGPLKEYALMGREYFDKQGYLIRGFRGINYEFTYDANHKPITHAHWLSDSYKPVDQLVFDEKGRIIKDNPSSGSVYAYDQNGNWTGTFENNKFANRKTGSYIYTYDSKNRVIKSEYYSGDILWEDSYTYAKEGDYLLITTSRKDFKNLSKNFKNSTYYKNGVFYGSVKNDNVKFDRYGNVTTNVDGTGKTSTINLTKYVYYGDPGVSDTIDFTFAKTEKPVIKNTNCLSGNCVDGFGTYKYNNGNYTGFFRAGKKDGFGIYQWTTGSIHTGNWKNDVNDGYGLFTGTDGNSYQGIFYNSKLNGLASHLKPDKTGNYGLYTNGQFTTKYNYFSNNITKGCTAGDCANGYGKFLFDDGGIYVGFFKNSSMLQGVWKGANGDSYTGEFGPNNTLEGYGNYKYKNGENYFGDYKNNKRNGRGILYNPATKVSRKGEWKDDVLIKQYLD